MSIASSLHYNMYVISKLSKQHDQTWVSLQQRLNSVQFEYKVLFKTDEMYNFIKNKAVSVGSCEGYFVPTLLTTTAYVLATKGTQVETMTHKQPLNLYTLFIGYPGTDSQQQNCLNKLLKSDEEKAIGDIQFLCKLFSGEKSAHVYSTEQTREIDENTPFAILGSMQLRNAANIIARMDHGHGLVDRFLVTTPLALRPTLTEIEQANEYIKTEPIDSFLQYFQAVDNIDYNMTYAFNDDANALLRDCMNQFVNEVNEA
ncbi:hypothetical protein AC249_AIPGENE6482 [Exaiptasia diaphana]|nr:hypothetical protein AC249_AIPGENE6482 [Exaiptasia diaphana]